MEYSTALVQAGQPWDAQPLVAMAPHAHSHGEEILPNRGDVGKGKSIGRLPHFLRAQECWEALGHIELVRQQRDPVDLVSQLANHFGFHIGGPCSPRYQWGLGMCMKLLGPMSCSLVQHQFPLAFWGHRPTVPGVLMDCRKLLPNNMGRRLCGLYFPVPMIIPLFSPE